MQFDIKNKLRKIMSLYWQLIFLPVAASIYLVFRKSLFWLIYPEFYFEHMMTWMQSIEVKLIILISILIVFSLIIIIISLFKMRKTENKMICILTIIFIDLLFFAFCILMKLGVFNLHSII